MIKENKLKVAISLFVTILPMLVGLCFFGKISGGSEAMMRSVKITSVFILPTFMLLLNIACIAFTNFESKNKPQHKKIITMVLWIIPSLSIYTSMIFYSILLGWDINIQLVTSLIMGVLFIVLGNYMPKSKQNRTFGIKIRWTLANEDNWNATHRFAGKMWFFTGFAVILLGFLPLMAFFVSFICAVFISTLIPFLYSYYYYKNNIKSGKQSEDEYDFKWKKQDKKIVISVSIVVALILIGCTVLMFAGSVEFTLSESALEIEASYHADESISYAEIDSVEYRENADKGTRIMGFASAKLLLGAFKNDELGAFTRFSYTRCKSDIIITVGETKIAISCESEAETKALYDDLLKKLEK